MRPTLKTYRPFLIFLAKFFGSYGILTLFYSLFLMQYEPHGIIDPVSEVVANQSVALIEFFGPDANVVPEVSKPWVKLYYERRYVARIVEGCNAVSVMILFAAFVIAFAGKLATTAGFIFFGSAVIYFLNIGRIALLCAALFHWPQYEHLLHGVAFPLIIYSIVFFLWIIWVNKFSYHARKVV